MVILKIKENIKCKNKFPCNECVQKCLVVLGTFTLKSGLAQMAKGGVVMDVTNAEQARIAEKAGVSVILFSYLRKIRTLPTNDSLILGNVKN